MPRKRACSTAGSRNWTWPPPETTRKQIVMVGDPLCGRSHRLGIGRATTIFHVGDAELPALLDKKHAELKRRGVGRRCDVVAAVVGGDGVAAALERAGLDADVPTKWVFAIGALEADSPRRPRTVLRWRPRSAARRARRLRRCASSRRLRRARASKPARRDTADVRPAEEVLADARAAGWYNTRLLGPTRSPSAARGGGRPMVCVCCLRMPI